MTDGERDGKVSDLYDSFKKTLKWSPRWKIEEAVKRTADWYMADCKGKDMITFTARQIDDYLV